MEKKTLWKINTSLCADGFPLVPHLPYRPPSMLRLQSEPNWAQQRGSRSCEAPGTGERQGVRRNSGRGVQGLDGAGVPHRLGRCHLNAEWRSYEMRSHEVWVSGLW